MADEEDWMELGACKGSDGAIFFAPGSSIKEAKAICADCPVKQVCLEYALDNNIDQGVWGGESERSRRRVRRARRSNRSTD